MYYLLTDYFTDYRGALESANSLCVLPDHVIGKIRRTDQSDKIIPEYCVLFIGSSRPKSKERIRCATQRAKVGGRRDAAR